MGTIKVKALKDGQLVSSVSDDTKWAKKKITYGPIPKGVYLVSEKASITICEGRENCGSGQMVLDSVDEISASRAGDYKRGKLVPTVSGRWANYGAPSGTHFEVQIAWEFVPDEQTA